MKSIRNILIFQKDWETGKPWIFPKQVFSVSMLQLYPYDPSIVNIAGKTTKFRLYVIVSITPSSTVIGEDETAGWHWENLAAIFYVVLQPSPDNRYISYKTLSQSELWGDKFPLT